MQFAYRVAGMLAIAAGLTMLACQGTPPGGASGGAAPEAWSGSYAFTLDRQSAIEQMAKPPVFDWRYGRLATREADELRRTVTTGGERAYGLKALATVSNPLTTASPFGVATGGTTGAVSTASAYHYLTDRAHWLTDAGYLVSALIPPSGGGTPTAGQTRSFLIKNKAGTVTQTFKNTSLTLSNDGKRVYAVSTLGTFLVVDAATGVTKEEYSLGRNDAITGTTAGAGLPPGAMPAPFIDSVASRPDGQTETVYVVGNSGNTASSASTLYRFVINQAAGAANPTMVLAQSYDLGCSANGTTVSGVRANPVVIGGRAVIGVWVRHLTTPSLSTGRVIYFDTNCRGATAATVTGFAHVAGSPFGVPAPVWAAPAVDVDNSLVPYYAFVPGSYQVTAVALRTGVIGNSAPLLVDKSYAPTVGVASASIVPPQSLNNYPYDATAAVFKTLAPTAAPTGRCAITVSGDATALSPPPAAGPFNTTTRDYDDFYTYAIINYGNKAPYPSPKPAYAYAMFKYDYADTFYGSEPEPRGVSHVRVRLWANIDSNAPPSAGKTPDPTIAGVNAWKVSNQLSTGATWAPNTITDANRPKFINGSPFSWDNLTGTNADVHLPNKLVIDTTPVRSNHVAAGNKFDDNTNPYAWLADGLVTEGQPATFAFYTENDGQGGKNPGKPFQVGAPRFDGLGKTNPPQLELELSSTGLANPTMLCPVAIDSYLMQIFAVNTNALYSISYQNASNVNAYNDADIPTMLLNMSDNQKMFYALTPLGSNAAGEGGSNGPIYTLAAGTPNKKYVGNLTAPLLTGSAIYVQDVFKNTSDAYSRTTLAQFTYGATPNPAVLGSGSAPVRNATWISLSAAGADAVAGPTYMSYDFESTRLFTSTWSPAGTGRLWVLNR